MTASHRRSKATGDRLPTVANAEVTEKERQAFELRKAGASLDQIAKQLGWADPSGAHRAIMRALAKIPVQGANELRAVESERLDRLLLAVWKPALDGDLKAMDRALRILDQRARLLGLNAPVKSEVDVQVTERSAADVELETLVQEMERRAAEQAAIPPA